MKDVQDLWKYYLVSIFHLLLISLFTNITLKWSATYLLFNGTTQTQEGDEWWPSSLWQWSKLLVRLLCGPLLQLASFCSRPLWRGVGGFSLGWWVMLCRFQNYPLYIFKFNKLLSKNIFCSPHHPSQKMEKWENFSNLQVLCIGVTLHIKYPNNNIFLLYLPYRFQNYFSF